MTSTSALARTIRLRVVPLVIPSLFAFRAARRFIFRTVSQTQVHYRDSALSEGRAGRVRGGDRLPWVSSARGGGSAGNFAALTSLEWQVHVYGDATPAIRAACDQRRLPLHVFAWDAGAAASGLQRNAVYLVRPDGYVGLAADADGAAALSAYLDKHAISSTRT